MSFVVSNAGVRIPSILYGTAWKKDETAGLVALALEQGFRGIDTAGQPKHYDEAGVGEGIAASGLSRDELYLQTKFTPVGGHDPRRIPYDPRAPLAEQVEQSFRSSLRNLGARHVDGLVLHSPLESRRATDEVWRAMERIVESGGARQIGISNCYALGELERLYREAAVKPAIVQNRFHAETGYDREIREFCRDHAIVYQSFWTLTANPRLLAHATVRSLAARYEWTPAQVLFRWLTQEGIVPLTGTRSPEHMRQDLAIFELELGEGERESLTRLFSR